MDNRKDSLLASAARLYSMGVDLEADTNALCGRRLLKRRAQQGIIVPEQALCHTFGQGGRP